MLRRKNPELTIEGHQVLFQPKTKQEHFILSTNILTPLYHFLEEKRTLPLWRKEFCWELILEGDSGFVEKKNPIQSMRILLLLKRNYIVLYVKNIGW